MDKDQRIRDILSKLENELKERKLWGGDENMPDAKAFLSTEPFCIDTLELHQWLEYVLIRKMLYILEHGQELPHKVQIYPMAVEYYRGQWPKYRSLIDILRQFDNLFV